MGTVPLFAAADTVWLLWLRTPGGNYNILSAGPTRPALVAAGIGTTYTPFGAYGENTGEKDCKEAIAQSDDRHEQTSEFLKSSSRYLCLPDTVDPRGLKGPK